MIHASINPNKNNIAIVKNNNIYVIVKLFVLINDAIAITANITVDTNILPKGLFIFNLSSKSSLCSDNDLTSFNV